MSSQIMPIYGLERTKLSEAVPLAVPLSVYVFPSTFCNFKCVYCAHVFPPEELKQKYGLDREIMSLETYRTVIDQLAEFGQKVKVLSLTGQGEPLTNKNIATMVRIAKEAAVAERIEIITNARLLTPRISDELAAAGLDTLRISLQGLSTEKYKAVAGVNVDFEQFISNIQYFHAHKGTCKLYVKIMDMSLEQGEKPEFYERFRECSDRMYVEKMLPAYDGVPLTEGMDADYDRYGRKIGQRHVCPLAFYMLGIFPNGDVEPCDTIYKPIVLGNVRDARLVDMWRGEDLRQFWLMQLRGERNTNARCARCNAPNDVSHPEDILDNEAPALISRLERTAERPD